MQTYPLSAQLRQTLSKGSNRQIRESGLVPGILYGHRLEKTVPVAVNPKELRTILLRETGMNTLINLDLNQEKKTVLVKALQRHPLSQNWIHVDFIEVRMDEPVRVNVPLQYEGKAKGVADGGIVDIVRRQLKVRCLPDRIPNVIKVDISNVGIAESIHVSDLKFPEGVKVEDAPTQTLIAVVAPEKEEVAVPVAAAVEGAAAAPGAVPAAGAAPAAGAPAAGAKGAAPAAAPAAKDAKPAEKGKEKK